MTSNLTGELRRWRRKGTDGVQGYVFQSDIWDEGDDAYLYPGKFIECGGFYLFYMGIQVYKLPKDEEIKDESGGIDPSSS